MPVTPTTKTGIFYIRLYYLRCSGYIICSSCFSTQTLSHPSLISAKAQSSGRFLIYYNSQITKHGRNGNILEVESLFNWMPNKNITSWTAMFTAYAQNGEIAGMLDKAEKLYSETPVKLRDSVCSNALISGYLKLRRLEEAFHVFYGMLDRDVVSWGSTVDGCCKMGNTVNARGLFDRMPGRNVVIWTLMINGYMKNEEFEEGFKLFLEMRSFAGYEEGIQMHGLVSRMRFDFDAFFGNSIITMYCRFGYIDAATKIFHLMRKRDVVSWNPLIAGYVQCNKTEEALKLFHIMPIKNVVSWTTVIQDFLTKG
ncbi:hypothetical protein FEM48_Zijuj01G0138400 [Ziziphus jujuba var. spinosa]|uniref:Uncharacterized protein n=1 Tax=Ziziphus jujuba var. spinosa TaxID=714518 RepID=A0A978W1M6_ZIZJJ|nr:hypothetical protein FEM48_Zijuj01G0138400 [Ziziphus jujuba var. spinosa]